MNRFMEELGSEERQDEIHSLEMKGPKKPNHLLKSKVERYTTVAGV